MKKTSTMLCIASALWIIGCGQNPLPKDGMLLSTEPEKPRKVTPAMVLEVPETVSFVEGVEGKVSLKANVPSGDKPIVTVKELPEGAVFNAETLELTWVPSFQAGDNKFNPEKSENFYEVVFALRDPASPLTVLERKSLFIVQDELRPMTLKPVKCSDGSVISSMEFTEESMKTECVGVESLDFPNGPFQVTADAFPPGFSIDVNLSEPRRFKITGKVPSDFVNYDNTWDAAGFFRKENIEFWVRGPRGQTAKVNLPVRFLDYRKYPRVVVGRTVIGRPDVVTTILVEDLNGETSPVVEVKKQPPFGDLTLRTVSDSSGSVSVPFPFRTVELQWINIPYDKLGSSYLLPVQTCVAKRRFSYDFCTTVNLDIQFKGEVPRLPKIDRKLYPESVVKYMKVSTVDSISMPITDPVFEGELKVEVLPAVLQSEISWDKNKLKLTPKTVGLKQFQLKVTSNSGLSVSEMFVMEALPWNWSKNLFIGKEASDTEARGYRSVFPSIDFMFAEFHDVGSRSFAMRETAVLSTAMMPFVQDYPGIATQVKTVKNLVLASPELASLKGPVTDEIASLGLKTTKRFQELFPGEDISTYVLVPKTGLVAPTVPVTLKGISSSSSKNPVSILAGSNCEVALELKSVVVSENSMPLVAVCSRVNGGRLVYSGVEWSDISATGVDEKLSEQWMQQLLMGGGSHE